jgi:hypothetical protein
MSATGMNLTRETGMMDRATRRQAALLSLPFIGLPLGALGAAPQVSTLLWALPLAAMGLALARPWLAALVRREAASRA